MSESTTEGPPSVWAIWESDLTVSSAQLDAVTIPVKTLGRVVPRVLVGVGARYISYGRRELERTHNGQLMAVPDTAGTRFPQNNLGAALHLGSEVSVTVLGVSPSVLFGDSASMDARMEGGRPEPFLRHDLYLAIGLGLP